MFITFEGIDGCGKSTQARLFVDKLCSVRGGDSVIWTKEPGGWPGGDSLRQVILEGSLCHPLIELFLFLADRCEHVEQVILPSLAAGKIVVCERYNDSTIAYQRGGRGIDGEKIEALFRWAAFPSPDITFWIDLPAEKAYDRMVSRGTPPDRLESEGLPFLSRVREEFSILAKKNPDRILPVDGDKEADLIASEIYLKVEEYFIR